MRVSAETKSATRQRILDAAGRQFAQNGFEATTTRDLAQAAEIGVGTLFNYFPTKESIALDLVGQAWSAAAEQFEGGLARNACEPLSLEEELFSHIAAVLRKLKPYRKYLPAVLETSLSPLVDDQANGSPSLRLAHLEVVSRIAVRHGQRESLSSVAIQLYWTLCTGVLAFWSKDTSPRQEDTLALLDQSLAMFVGWLTNDSNPQSQSQAGD